MSKPVEHIVSIDYSGIKCKDKKEAIKIANHIRDVIKCRIDADALLVIVLSNIDRNHTKLFVDVSNRKRIAARYTKIKLKPWHIHITLLSNPGDATARCIAQMIKNMYPSSQRTWISNDKGDVDGYLGYRIPYIIDQSVIIRTLSTGNPYLLVNRKKFIFALDKKAKAMGYPWLAITTDYLA